MQKNIIKHTCYSPQCLASPSLKTCYSSACRQVIKKLARRKNSKRKNSKRKNSKRNRKITKRKKNRGKNKYTTKHAKRK